MNFVLVNLKDNERERERERVRVVIVNCCKVAVMVHVVIYQPIENVISI